MYMESSEYCASEIPCFCNTSFEYSFGLYGFLARVFLVEQSQTGNNMSLIHIHPIKNPMQTYYFQF